MTRTAGKTGQLGTDRMGLVRRAKPVRRKAAPPKREVISRDIRRLPKPVLKIRSVSMGHGTIWQAIAPAGKAKRPTTRRPYSWQSLVSVTACLLLGVFSLHSLSYLDAARAVPGRVLGDATSAYEELSAASDSLSSQDFSGARASFTEAQARLIHAQDSLDPIRLFAAVAPQARSADSILTGAYFLAEAGKNLTRALQLFDDLAVSSNGIATDGFTDRLRQNHELLSNSLLMIEFAEQEFTGLSGLPAEYQGTLAEAQSQITGLKAVLTELVGLEDLFLSFFGTEPRTYLLVFQNYDEIRATGGFIGTYGVLKYENGAINDLRIESVYEIDGSLTKQIAAPGPFQPEIKKWAMRDSNWFADFPSSARKMLEFFEMESETADGVIALTPRIFSDILRLIGPVAMSEYGVTLTVDNFQDTVQTQTSELYDRELNQPKKFLDDFAPILLNRLGALGKEQWFTVFQMILDGFAQRHAMVYSTDQEVQERIAGLGFDGRILDAAHDYLSIVNSNLGGTKTDLDIRQSAFIQSVADRDGVITNTVRILRQNTADEPNLNYMRVLVPLGSRLVSATGFADRPHRSSAADGFLTDPDLAEWDQGQVLDGVAVRSEAGKGSFAGWTETSPGQTSEVVLTYELPFSLDRGVLSGLINPAQSHSLVFQKQPGNLGTFVEGTWDFSGLDVAWSSPGTSVSGSQVKFSGMAETDRQWGVVLRK